MQPKRNCVRNNNLKLLEFTWIWKVVLKDCQTIERICGDVSRRFWNDWQWQFQNSLQCLAAPARMTGCCALSHEKLAGVVGKYPFRVTPYYLGLIDISDAADPLRRQCFPDLQEISHSPGIEDDPLREGCDMPVDGLIHRYADRCLILATNVCAVYCRHCNRKRLWQKSSNEGIQTFLEPWLSYIRQRREIREVIVSGGDPLTLDDQAVEKILSSLRAIAHVEIIRIGTRAPVVMPMRITRALCRIMKKYRPLWLNTQFNHPREITPASARACEMLLEAGIPVSNQSVLLGGVNDSCETMRELLYGLQRIGVRPYYLFQCESVQGAEHFRVDVRQGLEIMEQLWRNLSGLCLPRYVWDLPGGKGKLPLEPFALKLAAGQDCRIDQHFFDNICRML